QLLPEIDCFGQSVFIVQELIGCLALIPGNARLRPDDNSPGVSLLKFCLVVLKILLKFRIGYLHFLSEFNPRCIRQDAVRSYLDLNLDVGLSLEVPFFRFPDQKLCSYKQLRQFRLARSRIEGTELLRHRFDKFPHLASSELSIPYAQDHGILGVSSTERNTTR